MKNVNQIIKDVDVSGKLLELCPPRPSRMDDAEYLVWLYECVCLNVSMGIGGAEHCGDYGGLRREIADLIRSHLTQRAPDLGVRAASDDESKPAPSG